MHSSDTSCPLVSHEVYILVIRKLNLTVEHTNKMKLSSFHLEICSNTYFHFNASKCLTGKELLTWNSWPVDMTLTAMLCSAANRTDFDMSASFLARMTKYDLLAET